MYVEVLHSLLLAIETGVEAYLKILPFVLIYHSGEFYVLRSCVKPELIYLHTIYNFEVCIAGWD